MRVSKLMTANVVSCRADQSANDAAQLMYRYDIGSLPVVDDDGTPVGMITDRDICVAAYAQQRPLHEITVESAMSTAVFGCRESDSIEDAEQCMRDWQVLRLPVVDSTGKLVGILSLTDLVRLRSSSRLERVRERVKGELVRTLATIARRRIVSSDQPL